MLGIRDIAHNINEIIKCTAGRLQVSQDINHLLNLEAELSYGELRQILQPILTWQANPVANADNVQCLCEFLSHRWARIAGTDAIYMHRPNSQINQLCYDLAETLASITNIPIAKLLMPTLKVQMPADRAINYGWIMSDDQSTVIDVLHCLAQKQQSLLKHKHSPLQHTHPVEGGEMLLSEAEMERVRQYTPKVTRYYDALMKGNVKQIEKESVNARKEISLGTQAVNSSYQKSGWHLLNKNLLAPIHDREQLVGTLALLSPFVWKKFLDCFEPESLTALVLEGKDLASMVQDNHVYNGTEMHDRIVLFLFLDNYRRSLLARKSQYSRTFGWLTGYSQKDKDDASRIPYDYLIRSDTYLATYSDHLKDPKYKLLLPALEQSGSQLGVITKQMRRMADHAYVSDLACQHQAKLLKL